MDIDNIVNKYMTMNEVSQVEVNGSIGGKQVLFQSNKHSMRVFVDHTQFSISTKSVDKNKFLKSQDGMSVHRAYVKMKPELVKYFEQKGVNIQKFIII